MDSTGHYNQHGSSYAADTVNLDLQALYTPFLNALPPDAKYLLDAGCGSGRDSRFFVAQGYKVDAFDGSPTMSALATQLLGFPVRCQRFQNLAALAAYDGIWACASLLHVPRAEQDEVARRLARALRPNGVLYASFKYGRGERLTESRLFCDYDEASFAASPWTTHFATATSWVTADSRPQRGKEKWLNLLLTPHQSGASK